MVRTPGFHPGNRGSIPLRATLKKIFSNKKAKYFFITYVSQVFRPGADQPQAGILGTGVRFPLGLPRKGANYTRRVQWPRDDEVIFRGFLFLRHRALVASNEKFALLISWQATKKYLATKS